MLLFVDYLSTLGSNSEENSGNALPGSRERAHVSADKNSSSNQDTFAHESNQRSGERIIITE